MTVAFPLRMPDDLSEPLGVIAKRLRRSKNFIVVDALRKYIVDTIEEMEDEAGAEIALRRINNPNRTFSTSEEMLEFINTHCHD